jgi:Fe2+ transport system protein B
MLKILRDKEMLNLAVGLVIFALLLALVFYFFWNVNTIHLHDTLELFGLVQKL